MPVHHTIVRIKAAIAAAFLVILPAMAQQQETVVVTATPITSSGIAKVIFRAEKYFLAGEFDDALNVVDEEIARQQRSHSNQTKDIAALFDARAWLTLKDGRQPASDRETAINAEAFAARAVELEPSQDHLRDLAAMHLHWFLLESRSATRIHHVYAWKNDNYRRHVLPETIWALIDRRVVELSDYGEPEPQVSDPFDTEDDTDTCGGPLPEASPELIDHILRERLTGIEQWIALRRQMSCSKENSDKFARLTARSSGAVAPGVMSALVALSLGRAGDAAKYLHEAIPANKDSCRIIVGALIADIADLSGKNHLHATEDFDGLKLRCPALAVALQKSDIERALNIQGTPTPRVYVPVFIAASDLGIPFAAEAWAGLQDHTPAEEQRAIRRVIGEHEHREHKALRAELYQMGKGLAARILSIQQEITDLDATERATAAELRRLSTDQRLRYQQLFASIEGLKDRLELSSKEVAGLKRDMARAVVRIASLEGNQEGLARRQEELARRLDNRDQVVSAALRNIVQKIDEIERTHATDLRAVQHDIQMLRNPTANSGKDIAAAVFRLCGELIAIVSPPTGAALIDAILATTEFLGTF